MHTCLYATLKPSHHEALLIHALKITLAFRVRPLLNTFSITVIVDFNSFPFYCVCLLAVIFSIQNSICQPFFIQLSVSVDEESDTASSLSQPLLPIRQPESHLCPASLSQGSMISLISDLKHHQGTLQGPDMLKITLDHTFLRVKVTH